MTFRRGATSPLARSTLSVIDRARSRALSRPTVACHDSFRPTPYREHDRKTNHAAEITSTRDEMEKSPFSRGIILSGGAVCVCACVYMYVRIFS